MKELFGRIISFCAGVGFGGMVVVIAGGQGAPLLQPRIPAKEPCKISRVVDGDTVYVLHRPRTEILTKLRLLRIDTPERGERYYKEATEAMRKLLKGKKLRMEFEKKGQYATGNYGRTLVYLWADDVNVCLEMVKLGWSPFYVKYGKGKYAKEFAAAEAEARKAKRGIWK